MPSRQVSHSELKTADECMRRWMLQYVHGYAVRPEFEKPYGAAKLGTRVHKALELWYGRGIDPSRVIAQLYREVREGLTPEREHHLAEVNKEHDLALAMVTGYVDWTKTSGADQGITLLGTEQEVIVPSGVPGVDLRSKLDQRVTREQDGARLFLDFKTVGDFASATSLLHMDPQMRFYAMVDTLDAGEQRVDGGIWSMLRKVKRTGTAKPPFFRREMVRFNKETLRATYYKMRALVDRTESARTALDKGLQHQYVCPPTQTRECEWKCQFFAICPMFDDGSNVEGALNARFEQRDPYAYYENDTEDFVRRLEAS